MNFKYFFKKEGWRKHPVLKNDLALKIIHVSKLQIFVNTLQS